MKRFVLALIAMTTVLVFAAVEADARVGGSRSFGSRGVRTFTPPAATQTAPNAAQPMQRTVTQPGQTTTGVGAPSAASPAGGLFSRPGLIGGLAAGFLGAGLLGMLFGNGLFGGLGGFASVIGLLLQVGLVILVARLAWAWWQRRNAPSFAGMPRQIANDPSYRRSDYGSNGSAGAAAASAVGALSIEKEDFDSFEQLLTDTQAAYSNEDLGALRALATPEMVSYFAEDLAANASRGVINEVTNVKLLQGDLAEAWREGANEYATVAMRFELVDRIIDRASRRLVEGDAEPTQATELWTFMRARGGKWILSAIQQA